jgi:hypothetical protein
MNVWVLYQIDPTLSSIRQLTREVPPSLAEPDDSPRPAGSGQTGRES